MGLMKINIKCCWQGPIERTGAKTARRDTPHFAFPFSHSLSLSLSLALELQSVKMHQLILMRFNSSARDAKPRPANVLLVPPKTGPGNGNGNGYVVAFYHSIFGHCPEPRTEPHDTARRCILMMPASVPRSFALSRTLAAPPFPGHSRCPCLLVVPWQRHC